MFSDVKFIPGKGCSISFPNTVWVSGLVPSAIRSRTIVETAPAFAEEKDSLNGSSKSIFGIIEGVDMKLI